MRRIRPSLPFVLGAVALALAAAACGPATAASGPPVTASSDPTVSLGRELFTANCNRCHGYPEVTSESEAAWPGVLRDMGKRASLDAEQTEAVLRYVLTARAEAVSPAPK